MRFSTFAAAALPLVSASPLAKRATLTQDDIIVLQLAHYLENLEYALYEGGYQAYSQDQFTAAGYGPNFREYVGVLANQEAVHRDTLASVLTANGQTPLPACTYKFPYTDPKSFVALGNLVTSVGIGAYLGGADLVMNNPTILTDAAAILTNEARHDAFLRKGLGASPAPLPFDTPLTALWAYNLAHAFIVSCPQDFPSVAPGVTLLPALSVSPDTMVPPAATAAPPAAGTTYSFSWNPSQFYVQPKSGAPLYIAWVNSVTAPVFTQVTSTGADSGTAPLPAGLGNVAYAVLTTFPSGLNETQLSSFGTLAGPAEVLLS